MKVEVRLLELTLSNLCCNSCSCSSRACLWSWCLDKEFEEVYFWERESDVGRGAWARPAISLRDFGLCGWWEDIEGGRECWTLRADIVCGNFGERVCTDLEFSSTKWSETGFEGGQLLEESGLGGTRAEFEALGRMSYEPPRLSDISGRNSDTLTEDVPVAAVQPWSVFCRLVGGTVVLVTAWLRYFCSSRSRIAKVWSSKHMSSVK